MKNLATHASDTKTGFFRSLWQALLRFDEALNSDPRTDLANRLTVLERQLEASRRTASDSPPPQ